MRRRIANYIGFASPHELARMHIGHVEEWRGEWYDDDDDDVGAVGRAKGKGKKGDQTRKGKGKGYTAGKGEFSWKCYWCQEVGHQGAPRPNKMDWPDKDGKGTCRSQVHEVAAEEGDSGMRTIELCPIEASTE